MYTASQDMQFSDFDTRILVVKANGGSITIQKKVGTSWIIADTYTADGAFPMIFGNQPVRFVPVNGCEYEVEQ